MASGGAAALLAAGNPAFAAEGQLRTALRALAGKIFYTNDTPGRWKGKEKGHAAEIKVDNKGASVLVRTATRHPMTAKHHIVKHMLLDAELNLVKEQVFDVSFDLPQSRFELNAYSGRLYVISMCNLHDNWLSWTDV